MFANQEAISRPLKESRFLHTSCTEVQFLSGPLISNPGNEPHFRGIFDHPNHFPNNYYEND